MHVVQRAKKQVIIIIVALIFIVDVIKQSTFFLTFGLDKRTEHRVVWSHNIACWIVTKKQCLVDVDFSLVRESYTNNLFLNLDLHLNFYLSY